MAIPRWNDAIIQCDNHIVIDFLYTSTSTTESMFVYFVICY